MKLTYTSALLITIMNISNVFSVKTLKMFNIKLIRQLSNTLHSCMNIPA